MEDRAIIFDSDRQCWLRFEDLCLTISVSRLDGVLPALRQVEDLVEGERLTAAGFISYEAAPAFDGALRTLSSSDLPLLRFGLYRKVETSTNGPFQNTGEPGLKDGLAPTQTYHDYSRCFGAIKCAIARGDSYQVNHTLRLRGPYSGEPEALMSRLSRNQRADYAAFVESDEWAICSVSPELFFRLAGNQISCKPMKGTRPRGRTNDEDRLLSRELRRSEKDRAENVMVVDMIRNDLGRIAEFGTVRVPELFAVERYATVWQMTSTVTATTTASLSEIMTALFPCASVTGPPKPRTMKIICELESTPRQIYTGTIGYYLPGRRAQFSVAIRTALIDKRNGTIEYGVGSGIVWDSQCADEYNECLVKAAVLTRIHSDFDLFETLLWTSDDGYVLSERHLKRLIDSASYFGWSLNAERVKSELDVAAREFGPIAQRVRLVVKENGAVSITSHPIARSALSLEVAPEAELWRVRLADAPVESSDVFLYHKTTNRRIYEAAKRAAGNCDDVMLFNERNEITESTIANVVARIGGRFVTPPVTSGLLAGTFRAELIDQGIITEQVITVAELRRAEEVYLVNSVRGWIPIEWADSHGAEATAVAADRIESESRK